MIIMFSALIDDESDRQLFTVIYNKYRQQVYLCAFGILGDEGLAEDAAQETFLRIAKNMGRYDFNRKLILTIARNAALTIWKKNRNEIASDSIETVSEIADENGGYNYDLKADTDRIFEIVSGMDEKYSSVFYLRFAHGLQYSEIGRLLDIDAGTAKKRMQRTKEHIRYIMEREE